MFLIHLVRLARRHLRASNRCRSHMKRAQGYDVLHPMAGMPLASPAEQYALDTGNDPVDFTVANIETSAVKSIHLVSAMTGSGKSIQLDPNYYKWTQWIFFSKMYGKVYHEAEVAVNWCPALGTVLANEEVIDGKSERGGHPVYRKPMKQWMLKITAYAERLLDLIS